MVTASPGSRRTRARGLHIPGLTNWKTWGVPETATLDGMVWFRRSVDLTAAQAAQPATLALGGIDEVDQTWVNGRIVRNTFGWGTRRTYRLPAGTLHAGDQRAGRQRAQHLRRRRSPRPCRRHVAHARRRRPGAARRWLALPRRPARGRTPAACAVGDAPRRDHALQRDDRAARPVPPARRRVVPGREQRRHGVRVRSRGCAS